jgi:hypothetical protein
MTTGKRGNGKQAAKAEGGRAWVGKLLCFLRVHKWATYRGLKRTSQRCERCGVRRASKWSQRYG